jgi:hypothetical protein
MMTYDEARTLAAKLHNPPRQHADVVRDRARPANAPNSYGVKVWDGKDEDDVLIIPSLARYARDALMLLERTEEVMRLDDDGAADAPGGDA